MQVNYLYWPAGCRVVESMLFAKPKHETSDGVSYTVSCQVIHILTFLHKKVAKGFVFTYNLVANNVNCMAVNQNCIVLQ